MIIHDIDPVAVSLGTVKIHWYGLMYVLALGAGWWISLQRAKLASTPIKPEHIEDLVFYCALGIVIGGRLGYVFFYGFDSFLEDPLWLFKVWQGGMAFHGGLIGVMVAMVFYARKTGISTYDWWDFVSPVFPLGLAFGRIGNFIGGELYGRASDVPWAMVFPSDPLQIARHPSQLYQAALEGFLLFALLMWFAAKPRPRFAVAGMFGVGYGLARFAVEFFREPDAHIGFDLFGWLSRGQLLSLPMIAVGLGLLYLAYSQNRPSK